MHLNYGKVATLFEVQSGSTFVFAKTARLGSEESSVPKLKDLPKSGIVQRCARNYQQLEK
jgi:hypothetical protein